MQFAGILPQAGQGGVEATGLQTQPGRSGNQDGEVSGSGFLSLFQGVQSEQSADSTTAEATLLGGAATDAEGHSLALALNLAGSFLTEAHLLDPTGQGEAAAQVSAPIEAVVSGTLLTHTQPTLQVMAKQEHPEVLGLPVESIPSTGSTGLPAEQGDTLIGIQTALNGPKLQTDQSGVEETSIGQSMLRHQGQPTEGNNEGQVPIQLPAGSREGDPDVSPDKTPAKGVRNVSEPLPSDLGIEPTGADQLVVAEPVFRLPETVAADLPNGKVALNKDGALLSDGRELQVETARPNAQSTGFRAGQEFHSSDQDRHTPTSSGDDEGSRFPESSGHFAVEAKLSSQGLQFAVPLNAPVQTSPSPAASLPATPSVQSAPLPQESPNVPTTPTVQFDVPNSDFGNLRVRVVLSDQTVHAHMVTDRPELGRLLVDRQDHLGVQLSTAGLDLGQLRVQIDRQGSHHQGYEPTYQQGARFHQPSEQRQPDRPSVTGSVQRQQAGVLSVFA